MEQPEQQPERSNKGLHITYLSIILVLTGISGFLGWKFLEKQNAIETQEVVVTTLTDKNDDLQDELSDLSRQFEDLKTNDQNLQKELDEKIAQIEEMKKEAAKNKNNAAIIAKLRKETVTLRSIMQGYVRTIDSMGQLNQTLRNEKRETQARLDQEVGRSTQLVQETENLKGQLNNAARITAAGIRVSGMREKRIGSGEADNVSKSSKVDKLKITFDVPRNPTTKPGSKEIYARIITPDGQELTPALDADHRISYAGGTTYFACRKTIDYQNENMSVTMVCPKPNADYTFLPGKYILELISDKAQIGRTEFILN